MPGKAPGKRTLALLLVALLAGAAPLAWAPEADGQAVISYNVFPTEEILYPTIRPDGNQYGCNFLVIDNAGTYALEVYLKITNPNITISPSTLSVILYPGQQRYFPICIFVDKGEYIINETVQIKAGATEPNVDLGRVYRETSFKVSTIISHLVKKKPEIIGFEYSCFAFSNEGMYFAVGNYRTIDIALKKYSSPFIEPNWEYKIKGTDISITSISRNGRFLAASSDAGKVYFFQSTSATPLWIANLSSPVTALQLSADGAYLAAGTASGNLSLFARDNATPRWTHAGNGSVEALAVAADGSLVAAGFAGGNVSFFGSDSATPRWTLAAGSAVRTLAMSGDGEYLVAGTADGNLSLFHRDSATPIWTHALGDAVNEVAMSADGAWIAAAAADGNLSHFHRDSATPVWKRGLGVPVVSASMSADGRYISAGAGNEVLLFEREGAELWNYTAFGPVRRVQLTADGEWLAVLADPLLLFYTDLHPIAIIDAPLPGVVAAGRPATFSGYGAAYGPPREFVGYEWNSSIDGLLSTKATFVTSQLSRGDHLISLRVQDADGDWSLPLTIPLRVVSPPVADAGHDFTIVQGNPARLQGRASGGESDYVLWEWDFDGDGEYDWSSDESGVAEHAYSAKGTYRAVLRVTDANGLSDSDSVEVTVGRAGIAAPPLPLVLAALALAAARRRWY